jgi:hypothetical protein
MRSGFSSIMLVLSLGVLLSLTACESVLSGQKREAVLSFSEEITDNLFAGLATHNYQVFSRDFDQEMLKVLPISRFDAWKADMDEKIGNCLSREVEQVTRADEFFVVTYQAECTKTSPVTVEIAFHRSHTIAHISFDSESLTLSSE